MATSKVSLLGSPLRWQSRSASNTIAGQWWFLSRNSTLKNWTFTTRMVCTRSWLVPPSQCLSPSSLVLLRGLNASLWHSKKPKPVFKIFIIRFSKSTEIRGQQVLGGQVPVHRVRNHDDEASSFVDKLSILGPPSPTLVQGEPKSISLRTLMLEMQLHSCRS